MKCFRIALCAVCIISIAFSFIGCAASSDPTSTYNIGTVQIGWDLYGSWITKDGTLLDEVNLSIVGEVPGEPVDYQPEEITIDFIWPDDFPYEGVGNKYVGYPESGDRDSFFFVASYYYRHGKGPVRMYYILFPWAEFVIFNWEDNQDMYLVAATDPNIDLVELFQQHKDLLDTL